MPRFHRLLLTLTLAALPFGAGAQATKPLVIVRFNQASVHYEQQLYGAIAKAVGVKPEVMFDLVSYAPQTGDPGADAQWLQHAAHDTQAVAASMQQMGVPMSRMRILSQPQPGLHYDETHVYAR